MRNLFKGLVYAVLIAGFFVPRVSLAQQDDDIERLVKSVIEPKKNKGNFPGPAQIESQAEAIEKLRRENEELRQQLISLGEKFRKEKALLYQEIGDAYTEAKLLDLAIDAYKEALNLDANMADVCYRLGLLYRHSRSDAKKGIVYLKKYLQLNPEAKDKRQIEYIIDMMGREAFPFTDALKKGRKNAK